MSRRPAGLYAVGRPSCHARHAAVLPHDVAHSLPCVAVSSVVGHSFAACCLCVPVEHRLLAIARGAALSPPLSPVTDVAAHLLAHRDPTSRLRHPAISAATARAACHLPTTPLVMPGRRHGEARGLTLSGEKKRADEGWNRGGERTAKSCVVEVAHLQVAGGLPICLCSRGTCPVPVVSSRA